MNTIEIKITSSGLENFQAQALSNFLISLGTTEKTVYTEEQAKEHCKVEGIKVNLPEEVKAETVAEEKPKATRTRKPKVEEAPVSETPESEEALNEAQETDEPEAESTSEEDTTYSIVEIRALLAKKIDKHKDSLKKKLGEFGASKVPDLPTEHYKAFYEFMESLD